MHWSARCIQLVLSACMSHFHNCEKDLEKKKKNPKGKKKKRKKIRHQFSFMSKTSLGTTLSLYLLYFFLKSTRFKT